MINAAFCIHCGTALLAGSRRDAVFCCANCRMAHHRAVHHAGGVLPFITPAVPGSDDDQVAEAAARALVAPFAHLAGGDLSPEAAMAEVHQAEQRLLAARRAAKKIFKAEGRDTESMFAGSTLVLRSSAERWREEAKAEAIKTLLSDPPKYESSKIAQASGWARLREEEESKLIPREPEDAAARERAVRARWEASTPEQRGAMIVEAAARSRPLKGKLR